MFHSYRLGSLFGFPILVNASFFALLAIVFLFVGGIVGVFSVLVAFSSIVLHELGHAVVARLLGVSVKEIELYFFGGMAKLTSQPKRPQDEVAIAAAGPAVSFAIAGLSTLAYAATGWLVFEMLSWINLFIGAFNLIPALPMDGGRIFRALLTLKIGYGRATQIAAKVARGTAIGFAVVGLVTLHLQLMLLAGVLWYLSTAEQRSTPYDSSNAGGNGPFVHYPGGPKPGSSDSSGPRYTARRIGGKTVYIRER